MLKSSNSSKRDTQLVEVEEKSIEAGDQSELSSHAEEAKARLTVLADSITAFRKAAGGELANAVVDIREGIAGALEQDASHRDAAELILLSRALERIGSPAAARELGRLLASNKMLFRWELTRLTTLRKERIIPFLIAWEKHPTPWVRAKVERTLEAMKISSPGRAFAMAPDHEQLVRTLAIYQSQRNFDAMEAVASLMNHPSIRVRTNARKFMRWYGRNGIWQLRRLYKNQNGADAPRTWGWKRVYEEVLAKMQDDSAFRVPEEPIDVEPPALTSDTPASEKTRERSVSVSTTAAMEHPPIPAQPTRPQPNAFVLAVAAILVLGGGLLVVSRACRVEGSQTLALLRAYL